MLGAIVSALIVILAGLYVWGVSVTRSIKLKDAIQGLEAQIRGLSRHATVGTRERGHGI